MKAPQIRPHGVGVRGSTTPRSSDLFQGTFGRIFRALPPADFGPTDEASEAALTELGKAMVSVRDPKDPKDGIDSEESGIPAVYTYFGQFIDHDLTFDPASSLQRQNDPEALVDYRSPRFDLDNVYGRGPDDQPYFYADGKSFNLGTPLTGTAANPNARDLPRSNAAVVDPPSEIPVSKRAIIGDPRNDENVIVSQFQGLLHRFHNNIAAAMPAWSFERVQREVRYHYQWIVLHDFLPTIVSEEALRSVLSKPRHGEPLVAHFSFYKPKNETFMPLEFSAAAYRFGHSMVRPGYRLSDTVGPLAIFDFADPNAALTGFRQFPSNWAIDWNLFAALEPRDPADTTRTQLAYKIDTSIVDPLGNLPKTIASNPKSLAERNLLRGWRMLLPSGQAIARAMGLKPLADDAIIIGKFTGDAADIVGPVTKFGSAFAGNCPLWTYVLAETVEVDVALKTSKGEKKTKSRKLGPVGGRIVTETIVGLIFHDSQSFVSQDPLWTPALAADGTFELSRLVSTALTSDIAALTQKLTKAYEI